MAEPCQSWCPRGSTTQQSAADEKLDKSKGLESFRDPAKTGKDSRYLPEPLLGQHQPDVEIEDHAILVLTALFLKRMSRAVLVLDRDQPGPECADIGAPG